MRITVNGVALWFDVEGAALVPEGPVMRRKPTLLLLHGGPGADHSIYKPFFSQLSDIAQIIYLDQRGNGRSDDGDPADWTLAQWGDDVRAFCEALGIERPIVHGASWGGIVAQSYATCHPGHAGALILAATGARTNFEAMFRAFDQVGGPEAEAVARRYWTAPSPERRQAYFETCLPLYSVNPPDADMEARLILKNPVAMHYNGPDNEQGQFDFRAGLAQVTCPVMILSGDRDVVMPQECSNEIEKCLTAGSVRHVRLDNCGHMQTTDRPGAVAGALRQFVSGLDEGWHDATVG